MRLISAVLIFIVSGRCVIICSDSNKIDGDINIALILTGCEDDLHSINQRKAQVDTATWIIDRLNVLGTFKNLKIGIQPFYACKDEDFFEIIFGIYKQMKQKYYVGIISDKPVSVDVKKFSDLLQLKFKNLMPDSRLLIRSSVLLLDTLDWSQNLTVLSPSRKLIDEFFKQSSPRLFCIRKTILYRNNSTVDLESDGGAFILFGNRYQIADILARNEALQDLRLILVPTDDSMVNGIGENAYVIMQADIPLTDSSETVKLIPSSSLFEAAQPILSYTEYLSVFFKLHCNETLYKLNCIQYKKLQFSDTLTHYSNEMVLKILKLEPLKNNFVFDIYKAENESEGLFKMEYDSRQPFNKIFTYNMFDDTITDLYNLEPVNTSSKLCFSDANKCEASCENFRLIFEESVNIFPSYPLELRKDSWVLIFLAISAVGVVFCLITLAFFSVCICRRDFLEGNPITTVFLLLMVLLMYCSVLLFSVRENPYNEHILCLLRASWTSLSVCGAFSLILSRSILLSTVTKEIAYMSHIPGSVQSFLTLFMVGVQAALSLQFLNNNCFNIFQGISFVYLMSYNIMLLLLILCLCPMIYNSQRNYKEGKFFTISAFLIILCWCFWISCYRVLDDSWKHPLICFAMVSTAIIIQGVVFVPRTYSMTASSTKNKLTNNLPHLNQRHDTYRTDLRQTYDCINVAAMNGTSVASIGAAGTTSTDFEEDIYNYPTLPRDQELNLEIQTISSNQTDKVTRF